MSEPFDPVLVEVINNEMAAVTEEIAVVIWRSGQSGQLRTGDFATAICDAQGRMIGHGFAAPFQLAIFEELMKYVIASYGADFRPGDVVLTNDPYSGMGHMPDFAVVVPIMLDGAPQGFCVSYSHHSDVGGRFPGSFSSEGRSSYEEGLRIPIVKLVEAGRMNQAVLDIVRANVRVPEEWIGDVKAKIAGCERGAEQAARIIARHGKANFARACNHVMDHAEKSLRAAIAATRDGTYRASYTMQEREGPIELKLALEIAGDRMVADFTGSSAQVAYALNSPLSMTRAGVFGALKCIIGPELPMNCGFFRPVEVVAPAGSVLNPAFPAPVAGRAPVFFRIFDLVFAALAQALPGRVPVVGEGGDALHFSGHAKDGQEVSFLDLYFGGWGARPTADGIDGVAPVFMGSYGSTSIEMLEAEQPVMIDGFGFVPDSAGAGRYRGSAGVYRQWRFLAPGHVMVRTGRLEPAPGVEGGLPGTPAKTLVIRQGVATDIGGGTHVHIEVATGDVIYHSTAGAGGFGDPRSRSPELVAADVRANIVSARSAEEIYAVAFRDGSLDPGLTGRARAAGDSRAQNSQTQNSQAQKAS
ncbi:MAG: hydantoinase B/oxoprolinase family protein [Reyranellaceae bacterium]